jgi:TctA family transporter
MSLPPGQEFNLFMTVFGLGIIIWAYRHRDANRQSEDFRISDHAVAPSSWFQRIALVLVMLLPLIIPSDWTQDVPKRYGDRHSGLTYSVLYPEIQN